MPKKQTQRGCAGKKQRKSRRKQRGGDLHKMYNYNNLAQDPQRMITTSQVPPATKTGGKRHSRKYYKRGGSASMAYSAFNNVAAQMTSKIANMAHIGPSTATQPVAMA